MKKIALGLLFSIIILLVGGCTQDSSELKDMLNVRPQDYAGTYETEYDVNFWGGGAGATGFYENKKINITFANNKIVQYAETSNRTGDYGDYKPGFRTEFYVPDIGQLCNEISIHEAPCNPAALETITNPRPLQGCRMTNMQEGEAACLCNNQKIALETNLESPQFPCIEDMPKGSISISFGKAMYLPENKSGFCYFEAHNKETGERWALPCVRVMSLRVPPTVVRPQVLAVLGPPQIQYHLLEPLRNVKCVYERNQCSCSFDDVRALNCSGERPKNIDAETKESILKYLEDIEIMKLSKEQRTGKICYSAFENDMEQRFCFNEHGLITFAQWGWNISKPMSTNIQIWSVKKTS